MMSVAPLSRWRVMRAAVVGFLVADGGVRLIGDPVHLRIALGAALFILSFLLWLRAERWIQARYPRSP